ncbi:hypothetical protein [Curtobacterium poinsettiae]|uniref:hypothetical protein n=1 Tax=Curtobacterium poinsettiae TaxID=159612 RepID=UPI002362E6EB|nr:hypothetical protein [Curtobacterium flaccumfaciens]MDD1385942.1 hypothetical protein [Curtobacterium flaccumfaciens pv. poinsettiae]
MQMSSPQMKPVGAYPPPELVPIRTAPTWAGELGDDLVDLTQEQALIGKDDPRFRDTDPLALFTEWLGPGDSSTKPDHQPSSSGFHPKGVRVFRPSSGPRRLKIDVLRYATEIRIGYTIDGERALLTRLADFDVEILPSFLSMREFARRLTQAHKPVATWLHTTGGHVGAESHHERTLMTIADFHPAVHSICGQPFTLLWPAGAPLQSHTPDVVVMGPTNRPLVIDVRTPAGSVDPTWVRKVPEIAKALQALGMGYAIWTGMSRPYRRNLENLTEAFVSADSYEQWSLAARALCDGPMTAHELADRLDASGYQRLWSLTLIRRMLWRHALHTDMFSPYTQRSIVWRHDA